MREEARRAAGPGSERRARPVRIPQIGAGRSNRHLPANLPGRPKFLARGMHDIAAELPAAEVRRRHSRNAIQYPRIAERIVDVDVGNIHPAGKARSVETGAPPGMEKLIGRQCHPAHVAESEAEPDSPAKTEKRYQRRRPIMPHAERARIPKPAAVGGIVEPAAIVIRRPAPTLAAHPRPAIPIFPNPAAATIGRPSRGYVGTPDVAIIRNLGPYAVVLHVFNAILSGGHILVGRGSL